jgi:hypothetical protein
MHTAYADTVIRKKVRKFHGLYYSIPLSLRIAQWAPVSFQNVALVHWLSATNAEILSSCEVYNINAS